MTTDSTIQNIFLIPWSCLQTQPITPPSTYKNKIPSPNTQQIHLLKLGAMFVTFHKANPKTLC